MADKVVAVEFAGSCFIPINSSVCDAVFAIILYSFSQGSVDGWNKVYILVTVRTEPSKPSNVLEFDFSVQVPSIVLDVL